jgi:hypothetical protein
MSYESDKPNRFHRTHLKPKVAVVEAVDQSRRKLIRLTRYGLNPIIQALQDPTSGFRSPLLLPLRLLLQ